MSAHDDVILAAAASLRSTLNRDPDPAEVVQLLVENQVPLLSLAHDPSISEYALVAVASSAPVAAAVGAGSIPSWQGSSSGSVGNGKAREVPAESDIVRRVLASEAFAAALSVEQRTYAEVHGNFERAVDAWGSRGIQSICFKSAGIAPSYPYTSENFDILFQANDEPGARQGLNDLGYVLLANCDEHQKWLYRLFVAGRSVSAIHLHTRVGWGQGFMLEDGIWARSHPSTDDPVTRVPGPEDVVLINAAHAFFENKAFGFHDIMKIRQAIRDGVDWDIVDHVARERGWLNALHFAMAMMGILEQRLFDRPLIPRARFQQTVAGNERMREQFQRARTLPASMPFGTSWKLVKILFFEKMFKDRHESPRFKPALFFLTLARAVKSQLDARPQNSGLFTLSGTDGSGKTAQAEGLYGAFDVCHLRVGVMWARLGATPLMHRMSRYWSKDDAPDQPQPPSPTQAPLDRDSRERNGIPRMVWAVMSSIDFALWLMRIRWRLVRGDIVIADRYLCDFDVELSVKLESQKTLRRLLIAVLRGMAAKPRKAFLLDVDGVEASQRALPDGGDFDPEIAIRRYRELAPRYDLVSVDARQPFDTVSATVEREGLRAYFNRYGMLGNIIFFMNPWQLNRPVRRQ